MLPERMGNWAHWPGGLYEVLLLILAENQAYQQWSPGRGAGEGGGGKGAKPAGVFVSRRRRFASTRERRLYWFGGNSQKSVDRKNSQVGAARKKSSRGDWNWRRHRRIATLVRPGQGK